LSKIQLTGILDEPYREGQVAAMFRRSEAANPEIDHKEDQDDDAARNKQRDRKSDKWIGYGSPGRDR
jgi:hypothetical protein